ncbi:MAG: A/G-specific adenine glycosylase [bacterium]
MTTSKGPRAPRAPKKAVAAYRAALVPWYREAARDLPWRREPTPYRVWVSEIMLQQTRVETVIPYFERFLGRFPTIAALAAASDEAVLEAWSGLGYYRRARNLHAGAKEIVRRHAGRFPDDLRDVRDLPGIGRYTAGAILSIALGEREPIVDGNVTRVLCRVFGEAGDVSKAVTSKRLWRIAAEVVAEGPPAVVNQAQMELGALVCLPKRPRCAACPCAALCVARRTGRVDALPRLPAKRASVDVARAVLLVRSDGRVLLRRRREGEVSPGLWDLPGAFTGADGDRSTGVEDAVAILPFPVDVGAKLGAIRHGVTYRRIVLDVYAATPRRRGREDRLLRGPDGAELTWHDVGEADGRALSSPARRILRRLARPASLPDPR